MIEKKVKARYSQLLLEPVVTKLYGLVSANQITWLSGGFGLLVLPLLLRNQTIMAILCLVISGYCDTLDGALARLGNEATSWGTVLDIVMDRCVELTVIMALFLVAPDQRGLPCLLMLGSMLLCITSFLVVGIFTDNDSNKGFHYSEGLMERAEAFLFFIAMMLWPKYFFLFAYLFSTLVLYTGMIRLKQFHYHQTHR